MSADRAYNCQIVYIELFIDKWVDLLMILRLVLIIDWPGALSLDKDIYNARAYARDLCTSCATENTGYLIDTPYSYYF